MFITDTRVDRAHHPPEGDRDGDPRRDPQDGPLARRPRARAERAGPGPGTRPDRGRTYDGN